MSEASKEREAAETVARLTAALDLASSAAPRAAAACMCACVPALRACPCGSVCMRAL